MDFLTLILLAALAENDSAAADAEDLAAMAEDVSAAAEGRAECEYKNLLACGGVNFDDSEVLQRVLAEASEAGWSLYEKRNTVSLRMKRPVSARAADAYLGFDPYRSQTPSMGKLRAEQANRMVAFAVFTLFAFPLGLLVCVFSI